MEFTWSLWRGKSTHNLSENSKTGKYAKSSGMMSKPVELLHRIVKGTRWEVRIEIPWGQSGEK